MFEGLPILTTLILAPLFGAAILMIVSRFTKADGKAQLEKNAPRVALLVSGFVLLLSILLVIDFDTANAGFQFMEDAPWLGGGIEYRLGQRPHVGIYGGVFDTGKSCDWCLLCPRPRAFLPLL